MIIYRGIAYIILEDQASGSFASWYKFLGWGYIGNIPVIIVVFIFFAVIFGILLHKTNFGMYVYAIGNNKMACKYSGVQVDKIKIIVFTLTGFMSGIAAF